MSIPLDSDDRTHEELHKACIEEVRRLRTELRRFTDDDCYGRCDSPEGLLQWFTRETRGLLKPESAHEVLDLLLNKLHPGDPGAADTPFGAVGAPPQRSVPVLWLDIDGTVRHGVPDEPDPREVTVYREAVEMMRRWHEGGGRIVGVTNQGGIALGRLTLECCATAVRRTQELAAGLFDLILMCSHHPDADTPDMARCWCRLPRIGLITEAALVLSQQHDENYPPHLGLMVGATPGARECAAAAGLDFQPAEEWRALARTGHTKERR